MKKIWNDEEAIALVKLISISIVSVLVVIIGVYSFFYTEDESEPRDDRAWGISVEDDHYLIEIFNVEPESLDEMSWRIINSTRYVTTWDDPAGDPIRMEGDFIDINFSEADNDSASVVVYERFYSREPSGNPSNSINHTLCLVYFDHDSDGRISNGDLIWVRPIVNGGCAIEDYSFRLVRGGWTDYGEQIFPPFPEA